MPGIAVIMICIFLAIYAIYVFTVFIAAAFFFSNSVQLLLMLLLHHRKHHCCIVFFLLVLLFFDISRAFMEPCPFSQRFAVLCMALVELHEVYLHVLSCLISRFLFPPVDQKIIRKELQFPHSCYCHHSFFLITSSDVAFLQFCCQFFKVIPIVCDAFRRVPLS